MKNDVLQSSGDLSNGRAVLNEAMYKIFKENFNIYYEMENIHNTRISFNRKSSLEVRKSEGEL